MRTEKREIKGAEMAKIAGYTEQRVAECQRAFPALPAFSAFSAFSNP